MVRMETPLCDFDRPAIEFALPGVDGKTWTLKECAGPKGLLVMFICNHCPYVQAVRDRILRDVTELSSHGIKSVAISANDASHYPEDSFDNMKKLAKELKWPFPYLYDESQQVARAYGAVCTPDFFGYNGKLQLQYRGRLDESRKQTAAPSARRDLFEAMLQVAKTGNGPKDQIPSMGCSIKWKGQP
ncbi:MAG: thioredoxin family protein [Gammaproteobacteria bacterium]|nr:thioredoxin family protein [Gammaproteobacteria bacterium]